MALTFTTEPRCFTRESRGGATFVEFHVEPQRRCGFPLGQLCHYTLDTNITDVEGAPPERLTMGFPTADVVVLGVRLGKVVEAIQEQALSAVIPLDARYAQILDRYPWVAQVTVTIYSGTKS
jgi:hypothetical protein